MKTVFNLTRRTFSQVLNMETVNQNLTKVVYEVRGGIVLRSEDIGREMAKGVKWPFNQFVYWNIGNPQNLGQIPLSFPREVLGYLYGGIASESCSADARARARTYLPELRKCAPYTYFKGMNIIREKIAKFITDRDNCETRREDILLGNGASAAIKTVLESMLNGQRDAILCPIPQYPLYSGTIQLLGSTLAGYYLNEEKQWEVDIDSLNMVYRNYYDNGFNLKAMVVINPGNPTGNILSEENIKDIIRFCYDHKLVIIADEVYQNNIYSDKKKWVSFKKVLSNLEPPYNQTGLFSFHSASKGSSGECGLRGGYSDMYNIPTKMKEAILKLKELEGCPNVVGQVAMDLVIDPPNLQTCSADTVALYRKEYQAVANDLKEKARLIHKNLNAMQNITCNEIEGALYAFPRIFLPKSFIDEARSKKLHPDFYYALKLLEGSGILTVPGSGFKEKEGTYHFRLTNLICPKEDMLRSLAKIKEFNDVFFSKYH